MADAPVRVASGMRAPHVLMGQERTISDIRREISFTPVQHLDPLLTELLQHPGMLTLDEARAWAGVGRRAFANHRGKGWLRSISVLPSVQDRVTPEDFVYYLRCLHTKPKKKARRR